MKMEHKNFSVAECKVANAEEGIIEAIVSVFNNEDFGNDIVRVGFFADSLKAKMPKGIWMHNPSVPVAKTIEAYELAPGDARLPAKLRDLGGLYVKGAFNMDTQRGREAFSDLKFGTVDEFSFGFETLDFKYNAQGKRELLKGNIYEWSPVLVGMNPATQLISAKSAELGTDDADDTETGDAGTETEEIAKADETEETESKVAELPKLDIKAMFAEELADRTYSVWNMTNVLQDVLWKIDCLDEAAEALGVEYDYAGEVAAAVNEFAALLIAALVAEDAEEDADEGADGESATSGYNSDGLPDADTEYMSGHGRTVRESKQANRLEYGRNFATFLQVAADATEAVARRTKARMNMRTKEGRMLSSSNVEKLSTLADSMESHVSDIRGMLESNAKPKSAAVDTVKIQSYRQRLLDLEASLLMAEVDALA